MPPSAASSARYGRRRRQRPVGASATTIISSLAALQLVATASHVHGHDVCRPSSSCSTSPPSARRIPPAFVGHSIHFSPIDPCHNRYRRCQQDPPRPRPRTGSGHAVRAAAASGSDATTHPNGAAVPAANDGRRRAKLNGRLPIISRTAPLGIPVPPPSAEDGVAADEAEAAVSTSPNTGTANDENELSVTIWEVEKPATTIELWWSSGDADKEKMGDPFGVVMWPGSILAAREMYARRQKDIVGKTILVLGAGTGLEAQAAAFLGAKRVIATDINALSLRLLEYGVQESGLGDVVESRVLDLFGPDPLPVEDVDLVLVADVLYNEELGMQVGKRIMELLNLAEDRRPGIIVTDSQRFHGTDFTPLLNSELDRVGRPLVEWEEREMVVTTSGILIEEDQTYNVTARVISI